VTTSRAEPAEKEGYTHALEPLIAATEKRLGQFLAQVIRDRALAEDVLQETFLAAFEQRAELVHVRNPEAWLFGIARNRSLHALRTNRRARAALERLVRRREDSPDPVEAVAIRDFLSRVLSADDRILVVLRYVHGFSAGDLATMTLRSPDAVRQRLFRARQRLLAALDSDDGALQTSLRR
jgi:RNA polymerase sigma-70 factor (ECF subfamily)